MKFKKWTFSFLAAAALIFALVAVFNYLVDPYRIYDTDIFKNKARLDIFRKLSPSNGSKFGA